MLYSIGKDSGVMLHLALKAFYPSKPPFPLLHVDTTWKFRDMIRHRDMRRGALWREAARLYEPGRHRARHQPHRVRLAAAHAGDEDGRAEAGAGQVGLRRRLRRRASRRGEEPREGARVLVPLRRPRVGSAQSAPGALAALQHAHQQGRDDPRVPAFQLDRARHLAVHARGEHSRGAAVLRGAAPGGEARRAC